jgi:pimeloyl-ACP methyl ester carboxylesterase
LEKHHLLLLPGLLNDAALWAHQSQTLADTVEVHVGDLTRDDNVEAMADQILATAPRTFALAGLSMGGYVAQEIMRQAPERVERLALLDTSARADTEDKRHNRAELIRLSEMGKFKGVTPRLLPTLIHPSRLKDPAVADVILDMAERVGHEAFIRQQTAIMNRKDSRPDLAAIRVPTVIIVGRQDALTPVALAEEMAQGIEGARLVVIEDCGHLSPLEQPHAITAVLRYWLGVK